FHVTGVQTCALPISPVYTALEEEDDSVQEYTEQDEAEFLAELLGEDQESDVYVPEDETPTGLSAEDADLIASAAAHEDDDQDWEIGRASCREGWKTA